MVSDSGEGRFTAEMRLGGHGKTVTEILDEMAAQEPPCDYSVCVDQEGNSLIVCRPLKAIANVGKCHVETLRLILEMAMNQDAAALVAVRNMPWRPIEAE